MREIKFRAWDKDAKTFYQPGYMYPAITLAGSAFDRQDGEELDMSEQLILMQYTGLNDKNGKEIYEGDIVRSLWKDALVPTLVVYNHGCFMLKAKGRANMWHLGSKADKEFQEVVGNIYEHPNLLTNEK